MQIVNCPSCGNPINVPEKKTGLWWGIGCLIAIPALFIIVAVVGLLAAIAIPSFVKARSESQLNACINNMRQLDAAKEQWALASGTGEGEAVDIPETLQYIKGATMPICPVGGIYEINRIGEDPACSVHGRLSDARPGRSTAYHSARRISTTRPTSCINNLRMIDAAKEQWALAEAMTNGTPTDISGLSQYIKGGMLPVCPQGGTYTVGPIGTNPQCSIPGHGLP